MSWWDTSGLTSFASNVVKSAQKKIDKVLDIEDEKGIGGGVRRPSSEQKKAADGEGDFWNAWLGSPGDNPAAEKSPTSTKSPTTKESSAKKSVASSWRSWGFEDSGGKAEDVDPLQEPLKPRLLREKSSEESPRVTSKPGKLELGVRRKSQRGYGLDTSDTVPSETTAETSDVIASEPGVSTGGTGSFLKDTSQPLTSSSIPNIADIQTTEADAGVLLGTSKSEVSSPANPVAYPEQLEAQTDKVVDESVQLGDFTSTLEDESTDLTSSVTVDEYSNKNVLLQEPEVQTLSHTAGDFNLSDSSPALERDTAIQHELSTDTSKFLPTVDVEGEHKTDESENRIPAGIREDLPITDAADDSKLNSAGTQDTCSQQVCSKEDTAGLVDNEDLHPTTEGILQGSTVADDTLLDERIEATTCDQNLDCDINETIFSEHRLDSVPEESQQSELSESVRGDAVGLSMIAEVGSDSEAVTDEPVVTCEVTSGCLLQTVSDGSLIELSVSDKQVTNNLLTVSDQLLEKSPSNASSIEIVSETEIEKVQDTKETLNLEITKSADANSSDQRDLEDISVSVQEQSPVSREQSDSSDVGRLDTSVDTCVSADTLIHSGEDSADDNHDEGGIEKDSEGCSMTVSSSSSVVKTMLEEAMEDSLKHEECDSHSHSSSDKSDFVKSEFSDKSISGHESGDEIDTTTSSDIEIISTPTPNGDRQERPFDLSPLKIALSRAGRRESPKHRRSDSQSSSSTNSKPEQLSPGRDMEFAEDGPDTVSDLGGHYHQTSISDHGHTEDVRNNPYETEKLLKVTACDEMTGVLCSEELQSPGDTPDPTGPTTGQTKEWAQKMAEMSEVINVRENKLVQLSKENNDLLEANSILRNQLKQFEEMRAAEMEDVNTLTEEFTQRLGESERRLQMSLREKDSLKKQLEITQVEMVKKGDTSKFQKMLSEKDEQIRELLAEGEKLSKQQLQGSTIIKKLRSKEKENEQLMQSQKKKLETQSSELEHLKLVLDSKEDMEKKQSDAIGQLNNAVQRQEKEISRLKGELEENQEKMRSMQTALDASYKEIAELHRANAAKDSKAQEVAVSAEMQAREELRFTMERENQRYRQEKEGLIMQIEDFRISLSRMEKEYGRREDMLKQEISDLQQRLQEDEARNQELTQSVTSATRPLLRQIENLQSTYMAQSSSWETVEKNITERLSEAQTQLAVTIEKERMSSEKVLEMSAQVTTLEAQNTRYRQDKSQLTAQLEMLKTKIEMLEDSRNSDQAQVEAVRQSLNQEIGELKREKILLDNQLEMEKTKSENEKKKVALLQEQLKDKERERSQSRGTPSPALVTRQESISSVQDPLAQLPVFTQEELLERSLMMAPHSPNGNKMTLYETLRQTGAANLLESLTSQLKQREGEITQLQSEITELERTRESMARELVNLSTQNDDLKDQIEGLPQLEAKHADLEQRYNALLQMYGEKVEETEELKLDLQDVKELYKSQIDHLMKGH